MMFKTGRDLENMKVDLHIHTTASDGTWGPQRLVEKVAEAGIGLFAVTDHDTVANVAEAAEYARKYGLGFIPGVEMTTTYKSCSYHVLGLGIDVGNAELQDILHRNKKLMDDKDDESIRYMEKAYPHISFDDYEGYVNNRERGGWKALNYLIDKKLCAGSKDFFKLFEKWGNPFDKVNYIAPGEAVKAICLAGGIPILAHPGAVFYDKDYKALISYMISEGIKGIECYHPENSPEITRYCLEVCEAENLLVTGGSDCHGEFVKGRCLGVPDIRFSQLKLTGIEAY